MHLSEYGCEKKRIKTFSQKLFRMWGGVRGCTLANMGVKKNGSKLFRWGSVSGRTLVIVVDRVGARWTATSMATRVGSSPMDFAESESGFLGISKKY